MHAKGRDSATVSPILGLPENARLRLKAEIMGRIPAVGVSKQTETIGSVGNSARGGCRASWNKRETTLQGPKNQEISSRPTRPTYKV